MRRFTPIHTLAFTVLFAMSICAPVHAQDDNSQSHGNTLEGVWQVTVTLIPSCSGSSGPTIPVIITFTRDGKVIETPGNLNVGPTLTIARVSPGLGTWGRLGDQQYSAVFWFFRINVPANTPAGVQEITEDITLSDHGDAFTSTGTSEVYAPNGTLIQRGCNTLAGTRLE